MSRRYSYPVWGTDGGGLVCRLDGTYVFVEEPASRGFDVDDEMPEEWGLTPANDNVCCEVVDGYDSLSRAFDEGIGALLEIEMIDDKVAAHKMSSAHVDLFIEAVVNPTIDKNRF